MDKTEIIHPLIGLEDPHIPALERLSQFGINPGIERIELILKKLNNPQTRFKSILVGGTNGKGSVSSMLFSILTNNGYRAGLFTSPHLVSLRERFRTQDGLIGKEELKELAERTEKAIGPRTIEQNKITYFEFTTAMAFQWFAEKDIEIAVLEVGMGGRLDATNIARAEISIITNIDLDHTEFLGRDIKSIAGEKAGIMKSTGQTITGAVGEALRVIRNRAHALKIPLFILSKNFSFENKGSRFDYYGIKRNIKDITLNLKGSYQFRNASLALASIELLEEHGFYTTICNIKRGLRNVPLHGRFEILSKNPVVLIDGAHNPAGIRVLINALKEDFPHRKYHIIFGALKDKDIRGMLDLLKKVSDDFYLTQISTDRAENPESISKYLDKKTLIFKNVKEAFRGAILKAEPEDIICITGSLYLVGDFIKSLR